MNFKSFLERIQNKVNDSLPGDLRADLKAVQKNNGAVYTGLFLADGGALSDAPFPASPIVYMEDYYKRYRDAPEDDPGIESTAEEITGILMQGMENAPDVGNITDYQEVKDRIIGRMIGYDSNLMILEQMVHRPYLDMAIVFFVLVGSFEHSVGFVPVTKALMNIWEVTEEEILKTAVRNTEWLMGEKIIRFDDLVECDREKGLTGGMYVLSNRQNYFGASVLLYSQSLKTLAEALNADIYILPASVHEVILMPKADQNLQSLQETVKHENEAEVRTEDVLTDSVYLYHRDSGEIEIM
ncbi:MAG: hypothetical protein IKH74_04875 [Lachnospiraceae bacterium]|nr:hypothetical protein [Lachnospiraceae bacterium]